MEKVGGGPGEKRSDGRGIVLKREVLLHHPKLLLPALTAVLLKVLVPLWFPATSFHHFNCQSFMCVSFVLPVPSL